MMDKGFISPEYFINMIKEGKNPEQLMMDFLQKRMGNSPLYFLAQKKDSRGIEQFARNYYKQQGKDFDKEFQAFKQMFGL
jgi:hypothetical protein